MNRQYKKRPTETLAQWLKRIAPHFAGVPVTEIIELTTPKQANV